MTGAHPVTVAPLVILLDQIIRDIYFCLVILKLYRRRWRLQIWNVYWSNKALSNYTKVNDLVICYKNIFLEFCCIWGYGVSLSQTHLVRKKIMVTDFTIVILLQGQASLAQSSQGGMMPSSLGASSVSNLLSGALSPSSQSLLPSQTPPHMSQAVSINSNTQVRHVLSLPCTVKVEIFALG